jgi:uncharacterized repeat protein (TIGR01451 family)
MQFPGANRVPEMLGLGQLPGKTSYFRGDDPSRWISGIPQFAQVRYFNVYPGVDLLFYGNRRQLEYDFLVVPGADPAAIRVAFEGADKLAIDPQGNLTLHLASTRLRFRKPVAYQDAGGTRVEIAASYVLEGAAQIRFNLAPYDVRQPLIIDPILEYSTYLGGSGDDYANAIALDSAGNIYVAGETSSPDFPTVAPFLSTGSGSDAFVAKINAAGTALIYSTYLGGSATDYARGIAVDSVGNVYVAGTTFSTDFPTASPIRAASGGGADVFVAKLNATGSGLAYSTYLGGSDLDQAAIDNPLSIDPAGNAYVTGWTHSANFPVVSPLHASCASCSSGDADAFVAKLDVGGTTLVYSTYLGGGKFDAARAIAADSSGNAYVTGWTESANFPTAAAWQPSCSSCAVFRDAFVTKLNATGTALVYSTYLGGGGTDIGRAIAVDTSGNVYIAGLTESTGFPTTSAFQASHGGSFDAFVTKLNTAGSALVYSTFLGGSSDESALAIALDSAGNAYLVGYTYSANFPVANAFQPVLIGGRQDFGGEDLLFADAFITKLSADGAAVVYSSFVGGSGYEVANGVALDSSGSAYVAGSTFSPNLSMANALQSALVGRISDAFVLKIAPTGLSSDLALTVSGPSGPVAAGGDLTYSLQITNNGPDAAPGVAIVQSRPLGLDPVWNETTFGADFVSAMPSQGACQGDQIDTNPLFPDPQKNVSVTCELGTLASGATANALVVFKAIILGDVTSDFSLRATSPDPDPANNSAALTTTVIPGPGDLSVTVSLSPFTLEPITLNGFVTYDLRVTNHGPSIPTGIQLTNTLPQGVAFVSVTPNWFLDICAASGNVVNCTLDNLPVGGSTDVQIVGRATALGPIISTASVTANEGDPDSTNNTASVATIVVESDLRVEEVYISDGPLNPRWTQVDAGTVFSYFVAFRNPGTLTRTGVTLTDTLPTGVILVSAISPTNNTPCSHAAGAVTCTYGSLAPYYGVIQEIVVRAGSAGTITNTASVASNEADAFPSNNTGSVVTQVVAGSSSLTLASSPNPSAFGQSVVFTATVQPASGSGDVTLLDGNTPLATVSLSGGVATFNLSTLAVGSHSIVATYAGDALLSGSTSAPVVQVVNSAATSVSISATPSPSGQGHPVTFTANVAPSTATGSVTFFDGGAALGTSAISSGVATFTTSSLANGSHSITATYGGDANFAGSNSAALNHVVKAQTSVTLVSAPNPSSAGQSVTFTATVTPSNASGSVQFLEGNSTLGTATLVNGMAAHSTSSLTGGTHVVTAEYAGDAVHLGSMSSSATQTVNAISLSASSSSATISPGATANFTLTVGQAGALAVAVQLSCSGVPTGWTCGVNPNSVSAGSGPTQVSVAIRAAPSSATLRTPQPDQKAVPPLWAGAFAALLCVIPRLRQRGHKRCPAWSLAAIFICAMAAGACGGGQQPPPPPPAQTVQITVNAVSGTTTASTVFTVTVQ